MQYLLVYKQEELGQAWRRLFAGAANVQVLDADIVDVDCDAVVSPANSFGFMDGGLDYALSERFGWALQDALQEAIRALPEKELLVGKALVIETHDERTPYLISAPTMRVPMNHGISTSVNAYLAMKAILIAAKSHPDISTVAIPGLCTGVGGMRPDIAAKQMYMAYEEIELERSPSFSGFDEAQKHQLRLNETGMIWN